MFIKKGFKIVLLGPQASGKGTQGRLLSLLLEIPRISTGEMFRDEIAKKTHLGLQIQRLISDGVLISDELTFKLLKNRLSSMDCRNGFILDGYPRNLLQAKYLDDITNIDLAIEIDISNTEAIKRISNRKICENCGESYDLALFPPKKEGICDKCGSKIVKRSDDYPDAIKKRLIIYRKEVRPILKFYKKRNILIKLNGKNPINNIFNNLKIKMIKKFGASII